MTPQLNIFVGPFILNLLVNYVMCIYVIISRLS